MSEEKIQFEKIEMRERCSVLETQLKSESKRRELQTSSLTTQIDKNHQFLTQQLKNLQEH